jgi:cytochrome c-type biogenesis protein CcmH
MSLVMACVGATFASAAETFTPEVNRQASEVFETVMSPYCPGKLIANCPSSAAAELRQDIRRRIADGASADEIRQELLDTYGEAVRAAPEAEGFNLLAWLAPPAALLAAVVATVLWMRRRSASIASGKSAQPLDADDRARVREALDRLAD